MDASANTFHPAWYGEQFNQDQYDDYLDELSRADTARFWVDNGHVKVASKPREMWETFKGWIGFSNNAASAKVSYQLLKAIRYGSQNNFLVSARSSAALTRLTTLLAGNADYQDLRREINAIAQQALPTVSTDDLQAARPLAGRVTAFYDDHEADLKPSFWSSAWTGFKGLFGAEAEESVNQTPEFQYNLGLHQIANGRHQEGIEALNQCRILLGSKDPDMQNRCKFNTADAYNLLAERTGKPGEKRAFLSEALELLHELQATPLATNPRYSGAIKARLERTQEALANVLAQSMLGLIRDGHIETAIAAFEEHRGTLDIRQQFDILSAAVRELSSDRIQALITPLPDSPVKLQLLLTAGRKALEEGKPLSSLEGIIAQADSLAKNTNDYIALAGITMGAANDLRERSKRTDAIRYFEQAIVRMERILDMGGLSGSQLNAFGGDIRAAHRAIADLSGTTGEKIAHLEAALEATPDNVDLLVEIATLYQSQNNFDSAQGLYKRAMRANSDAARGPYRDMCLRAADVLSRGRADSPEAIQFLQTALKLNPRDVDTILRLADTAEAARKFDEALQLYGRALQFDRERIEPRYRSFCLRAADTLLAGRGGQKQGVAMLEAVLALNPRDHAILVRLADLFASGGKPDKADEYYQRALSTNRSSVAPRYRQFCIEQAAEMAGRDGARATELYNQAWNLDHSTFHPFMEQMVHHQIAQGNIRQGVERYFDLDSQFPGRVNLTAEQWGAAIDAARSLPNDLGRRVFGTALEKFGDNTAIVNALRTMYEQARPESLTSADGPIIHRLAKGIHDQRAANRARPLYEKALPLMPSDRQLRDDLYRCLVDVGNKDMRRERWTDACSAYNAAYRANPRQYGEYMERWVSALIQQKDHAGAIRLAKEIQDRVPGGDRLNIGVNIFIIGAQDALAERNVKRARELIAQSLNSGFDLTKEQLNQLSQLMMDLPERTQIDAPMLLTLARNLHRVEGFKSALNMYVEVLGLQKGDRKLAEEYQRFCCQGGAALYREGEFREAVAFLSGAYEFAPSTFGPHLNQYIDALHRTGDNAQAYQLYKELTAKFPAENVQVPSGVFHALVAQARSSGEAREALDLCVEGLTLFPDNDSLLQDRTGILLAIPFDALNEADASTVIAGARFARDGGNLDNAITLFSRAVELNDDRAVGIELAAIHIQKGDVAFARGQGRWLLGNAGDYREAIKCYSAAFDAAEDDFGPYFSNWITACLNLKRVDDAFDVYDIVKEYMPGQVRSLTLTGSEWMKLSDLAIENAMQYVDVGSNGQELGVLQIDPNTQRDKIEQSLELAKAAAGAENPPSVDTLYKIALRHAQLGDREVAQGIIDRALERDENHAGLNYLSAVLAYTDSEFPKPALENKVCRGAQRALETDPTNPMILVLAYNTLPVFGGAESDPIRERMRQIGVDEIKFPCEPMRSGSPAPVIGELIYFSQEG